MAEITYGQGAVAEASVRLVPELNDSMRVIELGIGQNLNPIAFAQFGARTIVVDPDASKIKELRVSASHAEVNIECHIAEYADLGFATTGSIDLVVANQTLIFVDDLSRTLRQVNRVLKNGRPFIMAVQHPYAPVDTDLGGAPLEQALVDRRPPASMAGKPTSVGDWFTLLSRSNFRVDQILELGSSARTGIPALLLMRARKEGD